MEVRADMDSEAEARLAQVAEALDRADVPAPFSLDPGLPILVRELHEWLQDDRQWIGGNSDQWKRLLQDLLASQAGSRKQLTEFLGGSARAWGTVARARGVLAGLKPNETPDLSLRRELQSAIALIDKRITEPEARLAIWRDLVAAGTHQEARVEARRLWVFAAEQGLDPKAFVKDLRSILGDRLVAIKDARGEAIGPGDHSASANLAPGQREEVARDHVLSAPEMADSVVWLKYTLAPVQAGHLEIGQSVALYSTTRLRELLDAGDVSALPHELRSGNIRYLDSLAGTDGDEEIPEALLRVSLGRIRKAEAIALAHETGELIVSLGSLQGSDPTLWRLTESHVVFHDGREASASFHAPPIAGLTLDDHEALRSDSMANFAEEWVEELAPHLPLHSPDLRRAAQLAIWLRRSRGTWEPGRVVLCDRIFEQVSGWAGVLDQGRFSRGYMRLPWALRRVRLEIENCWRGVFAAGSVGFDRSISSANWERIKADPDLEYVELPDGRHAFSLSGVLRRVDFLRESVEEGTALHERLRLLGARTSNGKASAAWVAELQKQFDAFKRRERVVRNGLIHGAPVGDEMAASVAGFVDWLASEAIYAAVKGLLADEDLVDYFLKRRGEFELCLARLERDESPSEALFWDS